MAPDNFKLRILLLEDVASDALLIQHELRRAGVEFEARRVQSEPEFRAALAEGQPDIVLADYSLPQYDGMSALALVRGEQPDLPFIFVSGAIGEERAIEALRNGATDYVLKDRLARLAPAVARALQEAEERRKRREAEASLRQALDELRANGARLQILHAIDRAILAARSPAEIAQAAIRRLRQVVPCRRIAVSLFDYAAEAAQVLAVDAEEDMPPRAGDSIPLVSYRMLPEHREGEIALIEDLAALPQLNAMERALYSRGIRSQVGVPLMVGGQLIGAMSLWGDQAGALRREYIDMARQVADSLAVVIHNARLFEQVSQREASLREAVEQREAALKSLRLSRQQLQDLSRRLVEIQEDERRAIARELHDEAGQLLTALQVGLGLLEREENFPPSALARVHELKGMVNGVQEGLHNLAVDLRPASLDRLGLVPALRQYIEFFGRQSGLDVDFLTLGLERDRLCPEIETAIYRIIQEALTNVVRHAHAAHASVLIERRDGQVISIIEDDGIGFDPEEALDRGRLGLFGMQERAETFGGSLTIESTPGLGTTIYVSIPCDRAAEPGPTSS